MGPRRARVVSPAPAQPPNVFPGVWSRSRPGGARSGRARCLCGPRVACTIFARRPSLAPGKSASSSAASRAARGSTSCNRPRKGARGRTRQQLAIHVRLNCVGAGPSPPWGVDLGGGPSYVVGCSARWFARAVRGGGCVARRRFVVDWACWYLRFQGQAQGRGACLRSVAQHCWRPCLDQRPGAARSRPGTPCRSSQGMSRRGGLFKAAHPRAGRRVAAPPPRSP